MSVVASCVGFTLGDGIDVSCGRGVEGVCCRFAVLGNDQKGFPPLLPLAVWGGTIFGGAGGDVGDKIDAPLAPWSRATFRMAAPPLLFAVGTSTRCSVGLVCPPPPMESVGGAFRTVVWYRPSDNVVVMGNSARGAADIALCIARRCPACRDSVLGRVGVSHGGRIVGGMTTPWVWKSPSPMRERRAGNCWPRLNKKPGPPRVDPDPGRAATCGLRS